MIPRFPTNIYYDSSTPQEMASEYNFFYGPTGILSKSFSTPRTFDQIFQSEADRVVKYLLVYRWDPYMFHQINLKSFTWTVNGKNVSRCLVSLWIDAVHNLFRSYSTLPLKSLKQDDLGDMYVERMERELDCRITGLMTVSGGSVSKITLVPTNKSPNGCYARLTGSSFVPNIALSSGSSTISYETYGPDKTIKVFLPSTKIGESNLSHAEELDAATTANQVFFTLSKPTAWAFK